MAPGTVSETYHAALVHGLADAPENATRIGVVRQPTAWFHGEIDENMSELGPPSELLDTFKQRHEDLKMQGMCDEGAHNAAWENFRFEERYREYLDTAAAQAALSELADRVANGEKIVLVCYENDTKRCHRRTLKEVLERRVQYQ